MHTEMHLPTIMNNPVKPHFNQLPITYTDLPRELWKLILRLTIDAAPVCKTISNTSLTSKFLYSQVMQGPTLSHFFKQGTIAELEMSKKMAAKMMEICVRSCQDMEISLKSDEEDDLKETDVQTIAALSFRRFTIRESSQTHFIRDPIILQLTHSSWGRLQQLELDGCFHLTPQSIEAIATNCTVLKSIALHHIPTKTEINASLKILAQKCSLLETIILDSVPVKDSGIAFIAEHAKQLHTLELSCTEITNQGLLAISRLRKLHTLKLSEAGAFSHPAIFSHLSLCGGITHFALFDYKVALDDHFLTLLAKAWPQLSSLEIHQAGSLSELGMAALKKYCPDLKKLTLDIFNLTENSLAAIINTASNLNTLNVGPLSTTSLSEDDVFALLKKHSPNLSHLNNLNLIDFVLIDELGSYFPQL